MAQQQQLQLGVGAKVWSALELEWLPPYHDWRSAHLWMGNHYEVPVALCLAYVVVIFGGKRLMRDRKPFDLQQPLFVWNVLLAAFSAVGALCTVPHIYATVSSKGFTADMCTTESELANPWVYLFCLSKIPELLDTVFIVLRKKPLIFLHYYHHIMTLLYCWNAWALHIPNGGWFAGMNLIIHTLMYSYYAACANGVRFSNRTRLSITSLQILQMVLGVSIVLHNLVVCNTHPENYIFGLVMYASYMVLFTKLFLDSYVFKRPASAAGRGDVKSAKERAERVKDEQEQEVDSRLKKRSTVKKAN
jgi:elongation of very long chain fatty acids protein 6